MRGLLLLSLVVILSFGQFSVVSASCDNKEDGNSKVVGAVATGVVGSAVTSTVGSIAGFGMAGIVKGSAAATFQSAFGTPVVFSALQSIGATGGMAMLGPVGLAGAAIGGIGYYFLG